MEYICSVCGYEGQGRKTKRGSGTVEVMIWLTLLVPGPFYSAWRRIGLKRQCTNCDNPEMVRVDKPEGQIARKKFDNEFMEVKSTLVPQKPKEPAPAAPIAKEEAPEPQKPAPPKQERVQTDGNSALEKMHHDPEEW